MPEEHMADEEQLRILIKQDRGLKYRATRGWVDNPEHSIGGVVYVRGALMKHNTSGSEASRMHVT
jgi:hypothetical protein